MFAWCMRALRLLAATSFQIVVVHGSIYLNVSTSKLLLEESKKRNSTYKEVPGAVEGKSDVGVSKHFTRMSDTYVSPNTTPTRHRRKILLVQFGIL